MINTKKNKGCISDDLLDREIYKISAGYNSKFNIYVCNKKDDEELVKKAASIGLIEDVNNDDSNKGCCLLRDERGKRLDRLTRDIEVCETKIKLFNYFIRELKSLKENQDD